MTRFRLVLLLAYAYVGLAVLANWLASRWTIPVGLGRIAPAGVYCIAFVLVFRDWIQQLSGPWTSLALIPIAGAISYSVGVLAGWSSLEKIALASVLAFLVSELAEFLVFTPIRRRSLTGGVLLSGTVGIALDSYVFLAVAFGSQAFFAGQMLGKGEALAVGVVLTALRRTVAPVPALA